MSRIGINRNKARLGELLGIRARLVLLALVVVGPLMAERIRSLEVNRSRQIAAAAEDFAGLARHSASAQSEVFASVEAVLKSSAYIYTTAAQVNRSCAIMRASLRGDMPWIRSLTVAGKDGTAQCSTWSDAVEHGLNFADRSYFQEALATGEFVVSDYLFSRMTNQPTVMAAYLAPGINASDDAVVLAAVNLGWMSKIMNNLGGRPGVSAVLVDRTGMVLSAPSDQAAEIGKPMPDLALLKLIATQRLNSVRQSGSLSFTAEDGAQRSVSFAALAGTGAELIVSIDETVMSATANHEIRTAYLQLGLVCLFVLLGALVAAERLIIKPIQMLQSMAQRYGHGDWSVRATRNRLPAEFVPLARALYRMATKLRGRERELRASNQQLTVLASIDMLSGLANRRGFQNRLDFEWLKAEQSGDAVALLMIDVDHFKLFNDTYGHPEGDACLARIGEALAALANETSGFAGRYGGEEFCLLLPGSDAARAMRVGEKVRIAISGMSIPHMTSAHRQVTVSVGVASAAPAALQRPMDLVEAADAALYAAKHRGRNAVVEHGFIRAYGTLTSLAG
ncbi:diguanylate cyclase [Tardiphaga sp.]|uniref:sensor domain-containing diguanylate cyclase n=1 Tax=Tardiphaga sp. TaxID=1926292 RepID=UPI0026058D25|nr:diguanylate cyclase [Tardiphaga sp.]MDB5616402.1 diguanylate cyclase [Tardiphaga sp.]